MTASLFLMQNIRKTLIGLQVAAYEWIHQIKSSYAASKDCQIDHVVYNDDIDITELIKEVKTNKF
ncbi:hypothetical protein AM232_01985 [Bacillus sp. FJAT-21352]|nr:hypothetical protein AM232_01985 [Bacillus sp. FJAT-21352]